MEISRKIVVVCSIEFALSAAGGGRVFSDPVDQAKNELWDASIINSGALTYNFD